MDFDEGMITEVTKAIWHLRRFRVDRYSRGSPIIPIFEILSARYQPISSDMELDSLLPKHDQPAGDFLDQKRYLYLDSPSNGASVLPILAIKYDMRGSAPELRIRLAIFHAAAVKPKIEIRSVGFRYETPEPPNAKGDGSHNYYHVQLIQSFRKNEADPGSQPTVNLEGMAPWLPVVQPALPLECQRPVDLLLCCMLSLYGPDCLDELNRNCRNALSEALTRIRKSRLPTPVCLQVTFSSGKKVHYYTFNRAALEAHTRLTDRKCKYKTMSSEDFMKLPNEQQKRF